MGHLPASSIPFRTRPRQTPVVQTGRARAAIVVVALTPLLSACAGISMPLSMWGAPANEPAPGEITGSIPQKSLPQPRPTVVEPAPETDADVIRRTVATAPLDGTPVAWKNDATGNSGTIGALANARAVNGAPCRDFQTTLVTVGGIRLYRGRACLGYAGPWDLVTFEPADAALPG